MRARSVLVAAQTLAESHEPRPQRRAPSPAPPAPCARRARGPAAQVPDPLLGHLDSHQRGEHRTTSRVEAPTSWLTLDGTTFLGERT
jgi:hypothetical protein